jgi:hypothetical protein
MMLPHYMRAAIQANKIMQTVTMVGTPCPTAGTTQTQQLLLPGL